MSIEASAKKKENLQERRESLANALHSFNLDYASKNYGSSLKILGPIIDSLATATAAEAIRNGSPSLFVSLKIALQGIEIENCKAGLIGKVLNSATKGILDLIENVYLTKEDIGSRQLFKWIFQALILATISITWKLDHFNKLGPSSEFNELGDRQNELFGLELAILLILKTGIIQLIVKDTAKSCGANAIQQESIAKLTKALILILVILTAAKGKSQSMKMLVLDLKDHLIEGLEDIQNFINEAIEKEKAGHQATTLSICIQQAIASLNNEDLDTLNKAYAGALEVIQADPKLMDEDIEKVTQFAELIDNAFIQGSLELHPATTSLMI